MIPELEQILQRLDALEQFRQQAASLENLFNTHTHMGFDGSRILTAWPGKFRQSAYASGSAYALTTSAALLNFGTTDPSITIGTAGVYLLFATTHLKYNGATFAANRTVTLKIRKTSGTAADVSNSSRTFVTDVITTQTYSAGVIPLPVVVYTAAKGDILQVWGSIDTGPSAGSIDAIEAEIVAIRIV